MLSKHSLNQLFKAEYGRSEICLATIACRINEMIVFVNWSTCELASGILLPYITANLLDEVGATWVNVDVIILHKFYAVDNRVFSLAARSNAIHTKLVSQLGYIFWICTVRNDLLLRKTHFIYCLINLSVRHVLAVKLTKSINLTICLVKNQTNKRRFIVGNLDTLGFPIFIRGVDYLFTLLRVLGTSHKGISPLRYGLTS